jgi:hypothetical protein
MFNAHCEKTTNLLAIVPLQDKPMDDTYNVTLSPQDMPIATRAYKLSQLYAKYRVKFASIRIQSAVSTETGGQYGAFFDPNPKNDWNESAAALNVLTSMPAQAIGAAWQAMELVIPKGELDKFQELNTNRSKEEELVTRFGQLVVVTIVPPAVTPPGSAMLSIWLDAEWEFYEPNVTPPTSDGPITLGPGQWLIETAGRVHPPAVSMLTKINTAYQVVPAFPATMFANDGAVTQYLARSSDAAIFAFATEAFAVDYAIHGGSTNVLAAGTAASPTLPVCVGIPIAGAPARASLHHLD